MEKRIIRNGLPPVLLAAVCCVCLGLLSGAGFRQNGTVSSADTVFAAGTGDDALLGSAAEELNLYAQSAVLMDADTGRILYAKNADTFRPMASTTKIMTCILALEMCDLDDTVTVSAYAAGQPKVHLGAPAGRTFRLEDLLYSLMLESHNDSAVMIAEHTAGDVKAFAEMMNEKAKELGCEDTWFITPNGLDASETYDDGSRRDHGTTAADLARIMAYCVWESPRREKFLEITRTQNYFFTDLEGKGSYSCRNHNQLLSLLSGAVSGKTGFTGGAGYCYVAAFEDGDERYTLALLGCGWPPNKSYKWKDARTLFDYGTRTYHTEDVFCLPRLPALRVMNGIPGNGDISEQAEVELTLNLAEEEKSLPALIRDGEKISLRVRIPQDIPAPVRKGEKVGEVSCLLGETLLRTYPVYAEEEVPKITWIWCVQHILRAFTFTGQ